jgi:hypothetical protein
MVAMCFTANLLAGATQSSSLEWANASGITAADKTAILDLARRVGLENPRRVSVAEIHPVGGTIVIVASEVETTGPRRTWRELSVCRRDWRCASRDGVRVGRWVSGSIQSVMAWRVTDNGWYVDVHLSEGVSFPAVERIVLAIRRQEVVNRLPTIFVGREFHPEMPFIDVSKIRTVKLSAHYPGGYEVWTSDGGAGEVFTFRIEGGVVELHATGQWVAQLDAPLNPPLQRQSAARCRGCEARLT